MDKPPSSFLEASIGRRLRLTMLFFALLFSLNAIAQYLFIKSQLAKARTSQAETWATESNRDIGYSTKWNLKEFRQADWNAPSTFIFATNGVLSAAWIYRRLHVRQLMCEAGLREMM